MPSNWRAGLRADMLQPNLGPSTSPTSTDFGRITSQSSATNRWIQIQGRIRF